MIRIFGDTTSGLTLEQAKSLGIEFIPQLIIFGEKTYRDDTELDPVEFVKKLEASPTLPKTAAPPPALYTEIFEDMYAKGDSAIIICPSSGLSGTVRSATTAKADFPALDIRVVDTKGMGSTEAVLLEDAVRWRDEGKTLDEIEAAVREKASRGRLLALVDTLEYLHKGGRIGNAAKFFGDILQLKPILTLEDGIVTAHEKQRTKKKALARMIELLQETCPDLKAGDFAIDTRPNNPDTEDLVAVLKEKFGVDDIPVYNAPACLMVHAGPGVIIFDYFTK